jgi:hypothetical protein
MPARKFPLPDGNIVAWALQNPEAVAELITFLNKVRYLRVRYQAVSGPPTGGIGLVESATDLVLPLPQFSARIPIVEAGGTTDANCRATVDRIVNSLTQINLNP